jgi:hypothetical protein
MRSGQARPQAIAVRMSGRPSWASRSRRRTRPASAPCSAGAPPPRCARRQAEQPVRLDHLQALVHQGGRVDRDLAAHRPVRMGAGLLRRDRGQRSRRAAERAAGGGQHDPPHAAARPRRRQALEDRVVLAVDRQQLAAAARTACISSVAGHTSASLLASSRRLPARAAARVEPGRRRRRSRRPRCRRRRRRPARPAPRAGVRPRWQAGAQAVGAAPGSPPGRR